MKKLLLLGLLQGLTTAAAADTVSLRADLYCPLNCIPSSDLPGYAVEVAREAFKAAGHTVDYQVLNWARVINSARKGEIDGAIGASKTDGRDFIFPEESIGRGEYVMYVRKGDAWRYNGVASLEGVVLGVVNNYSYQPELDAYIKKNLSNKSRIVQSVGDMAIIDNIKRLSSGAVQVMIEDRVIVDYYLEQLKLEQNFVEAGKLPASDLFIAFGPKGKKSAEYAGLITDGLRSMRKSGKLATILAKYKVKDWKDK